MASIVFTIPVRKNSQRVENKMLRPFAGSSLFEIYLDKIEEFKDIVRIVAYEDDFIDIAKKRGFCYLRRNRESAFGETSPVIHNYLKDVKEEFIYMATACCPLMRKETLRNIMKILKENCNDSEYHGLITVRTCGNVVWDSDKRVVNEDVRLFNTKLRRPLYIETSSVFVFRRERFLKLGAYWDFGIKDPDLYVIDSQEAMDIDTEADFEMAEILYTKYKEEL